MLRKAFTIALLASLSMAMLVEDASAGCRRRRCRRRCAPTTCCTSAPSCSTGGCSTGSCN